jgi:hypothetical protein
MHSTVNAKKANKDRQYNVQKKKTNGQIIVHKTLHKKLKIELHVLPYKLRVNSGAPEGLEVPVTLVTAVM